MRTTRAILIGVILAALMVPLAYSIFFIGPTMFIATHGGNVTFSQNFQATSLTYVNGLNHFTNLVWGGRNQGALGFDCGGGVNMTVTDISTNQVHYTVAYGVVNITLVARIGAGPPTGVTGGTYVYSAVTETTTVTPAAPGGIVISWAVGTVELYSKTLVYIGVASLIPVVVAMGYLMALLQGMPFEPKQAVVVIVSLVAAFAVIAALLAVYV